MFKLEQIGKEHSDGTIDFMVILDREYTVSLNFFNVMG